MQNINFHLSPHEVAPLTIALLLGALGIGVLLSWHNPQLFAGLYPYATLMAYNTAIGFCACGIGLYSILKQRSLLKTLSVLVLLTIGTSTLLDLIGGFPLNTTQWFEIFLTESPTYSQPTSPTTSSAFIIAGVAIWLGYSQRGTKTVVACLLCIIILFLLFTAMISQGFGVLPDFIWLGIKIAPHTAVGLFLFSVGLITLRYLPAIEAFNRFNVFRRLATGFVFMSLLFLGIGSIGMLQINSVASITQELYEDPVQVNNAVLRVKGNFNTLNRRMKDIAVNPQLANSVDIPATIKQVESAVIEDLDFLTRKTNSTELIQLHSIFNQWRLAILANYEQLVAGNIDLYRQNTLNEMQELTIAMENHCEVILQHAQARMLELNDEVTKTKTHAGNLMLTVICGFLLLGFAIAAGTTRSLNWQLQQIRSTMEQLAEGHTKVPIPFLDHPHEIGIMANTLAVFAENIDARQKNAQLLIQHQADLESSNFRLAQTNKELETFAYVASHDLKSPLRGIAQLSSWIEEDIDDKNFSEVGKHTLMLRNRIHRMEKLLDDLLIFYRAGKTDGKITTVDVTRMATELFEIQNTKPGLHLKLSASLPKFETLSTPFEQVLRNLFSNAIKHHDLDQGFIALDCQEGNNGFYEFSVSDDGPGIPTKFQERVFGMFQTLKPRDELEGSGMGLALIKKLVETYGGNIRVFSEGRGCRFTFTWPQVIQEKMNP
ncbi:MAG TPA: ATP-binding protein [Cellvibrio sp.]|nr:ATP-binding protein [Cellvibrio sp.]